MSKEDHYLECVLDPVVEMLAIKLFEHDSVNGRPPKTANLGWMSLPNEDRQLFRRMARGAEPIGYVPED